MNALVDPGRASLGIVKPGLLTTVQDLGRWGYQCAGVVVGGALDNFAARVANTIVGNPDQAAVLEMAQIGPNLQFASEALVAWCGAEFPALVDGEPIAPDRAVRIAAGEVLTFGLARRGVRAWLAVAGGIDVPLVLGSRSTYRRAGLGGHEGRALAREDQLKLGPPSPWANAVLARLRGRGERATSWSVRPTTLGTAAPDGVVRVMRGPEWDWFAPEAHDRLLHSSWRATKDADRMGVRLEGAALELRNQAELISTGVNAGVIQVPAGGQPIVLLAGRQSVGGYPRMAAAATVDLGPLAQMRPGDSVRFEEITLAAAHAAFLARERHFKMVRTGLSRLCG